jgi:hypothetical protein
MKGLIPSGLPRRRAFAGAGAVLVLAVLATGCSVKEPIQTTPSGTAGLAQKLTPFLYFEDGAVLFVGVDTRAAQYVKQGTMFPLGIALANQSKTSLSFSRESFTLESPDGRKFPLVTVEEFNRDYNRSRSDVQMADSAIEALNARFGNYIYAPREFYPMRGAGTTSQDSFEMGRLFWTYFYVYFPIPENGFQGQELTLLVDAGGHDETFVVRFKVK